MNFRFHAAGLHAMPMVMAPPTAATTSRKNKSQRCSICGGLGRTPPPAARGRARASPPRADAAARAPVALPARAHLTTLLIRVPRTFADKSRTCEQVTSDVRPPQQQYAPPTLDQRTVQAALGLLTLQHAPWSPSPPPVVAQPLPMPRVVAPPVVAYPAQFAFQPLQYARVVA